MNYKGFIFGCVSCIFMPAYAWAVCIKAEAVVNTTDTPCMMIVTSTGFVGVNLGSASPEANLHVNGSFIQKSPSQLGGIRMLVDGNAEPRAALVLDIDHADGIGSGSDYLLLSQTLTEGWLASAIDTPLHFGSSNARHMTISTIGRVGINTSNPLGRLHITSSNNEHKLIIQGYGSSLGYGVNFLPANDANPTAVGFSNASGSSVGSIATTVSTTAFNTTSDHRLKENLSPIPNALDRVGALNPVAYNFKNDPDVRTEGFVAHEVQSIAPYAVSGEKDALDADGNPIYQQVDYGKLTPLLAAAIQELHAENAALRAEIEALKSSR